MAGSGSELGDLRAAAAARADRRRRARVSTAQSGHAASEIGLVRVSP